MPRLLATAVWGCVILALFWLARDRNARTSIALWIPVVWLLIAGSRNVAVWLQMNAPMEGDRYLEGNALDRNVLTVLMAMGLGVLLSRGRRVGALLRGHKFKHFRVWYRDALSEYVKEMLLDSRSLARPYLQRGTLEMMLKSHTKGDRNYTTQIHKMLTLELIHRLFFDQK